MPNIPLVGQVPVEINNIPVPEITKVEVSHAPPVNVRFGAYGPIGSSQGQAKVQVKITFAVPKVEASVDLDALSADPEGFTVTYPEGARRWMVLGCHKGDDTLSNDPEKGETDKSVTVVGTEKVQI